MCSHFICSNVCKTTLMAPINEFKVTYMPYTHTHTICPDWGSIITHKQTHTRIWYHMNLSTDTRTYPTLFRLWRHGSVLLFRVRENKNRLYNKNQNLRSNHWLISFSAWSKFNNIDWQMHRLLWQLVVKSTSKDLVLVSNISNGVMKGVSESHKTNKCPFVYSLFGLNQFVDQNKGKLSLSHYLSICLRVCARI